MTIRRPLSTFERKLLEHGGFDTLEITDEKVALRERVLSTIQPDADLWERLWPLTDAYGEAGFIPSQGYDWSGFRDSSYAAISAMALVIDAERTET